MFDAMFTLCVCFKTVHNHTSPQISILAACEIHFPFFVSLSALIHNFSSDPQHSAIFYFWEHQQHFAFEDDLVQNPLAIARTEIGPQKLINIHELPSCTSLFCFLSFLVSPSQRPRHDLRPRRSYNVLLSADGPQNRLGASLLNIKAMISANALFNRRHV